MPIQSITHLWPFYSASTQPNLTTMGIWQTVIWWHLWGRKKKKRHIISRKKIRHWTPHHLPSPGQIEGDRYQMWSHCLRLTAYSKARFRINIPAVQSGSSGSTHRLTETNWKCLCFSLSDQASSCKVGHLYPFAVPSVE